MPEPLENTDVSQSNIWLQKASFQKGLNYQVFAASGKGKSTFVHLLYGIRNDYKGHIWFDNKPIDQLTNALWANIRQTSLSIVFQDLRLFPHLTALQNIQVKAVLQPSVASVAEIEAMADRLGIAHVLNKPAKTLSYGERQRTAIIRSLVQPFDFLLLDEPFSHLDEQNIAKAAELIQEKCTANRAGFVMTSLGYEYVLRIDQKYAL